MKKVVTFVLVVLSISISGKLFFVTEVVNHLLSGGSLSIGLFIGITIKLLIVGGLFALKIELLMWIFKITRIDKFFESLAISLKNYWNTKNKKEIVLLTNGK